MLLRTAIVAVAAGASGTAYAAEATISPGEEQVAPAKVELIDNSRLGCGQDRPMWTNANGGGQCAFDTATRGARISVRHDLGSGSIEAYATAAHSTAGAFTPDRLLVSRTQRASEATDLFLLGVKASALDGRVKLSGEFARTERIVDALITRDWALADSAGSSGTSASVRLDATLADRPGLKWSVSGDYRNVSSDYATGRSIDLFRYSALPGSRLTLSTKARIGQLGVTAGIEQSRRPYGQFTARKAGVDFDGVSLRLVARESNAAPPEGSSLLDSRTRSNAAYLDLDFALLAASLLPDAGELPFFVPTNVSLSYRSGETENRYQASAEHYGRSSFGIDGSWETPIGETSLGYWRDTRTALSAGARAGTSETLQLDHMVRWGNWRFGVDASLSRGGFDGVNGFGDRSLSFGQSIAYSTPGGPEFRLQVGQDRGRMRMRDDSYASVDRYSRITASLDLSRYLQKRFERPDLRLTLDYRKVIDRTDSEMILSDELVDHWVDGDRREGALLSFGMKL